LKACKLEGRGLDSCNAGGFKEKMILCILPASRHPSLPASQLPGIPASRHPGIPASQLSGSFYDFIEQIRQLLFIPAFQKKSINKSIVAAEIMNAQIGAFVEFELIKIFNRYDRIVFGCNNRGINR
jgi:hypothetical protein